MRKKKRYILLFLIMISCLLISNIFVGCEQKKIKDKMKDIVTTINIDSINYNPASNLSDVKFTIKVTNKNLDNKLQFRLKFKFLSEEGYTLAIKEFAIKELLEANSSKFFTYEFVSENYEDSNNYAIKGKIEDVKVQITQFKFINGNKIIKIIRISNWIVLFLLFIGSVIAFYLADDNSTVLEWVTGGIMIAIGIYLLVISIIVV